MSKKANPTSIEPMSNPVARRFLIEGHVQGVFFREWTVSKAREMGLSGYVRNLIDGRVEVYAIGPSTTLDQLAGHLRKGSPASKVAEVTAEPAAVERLHGFSRRQNA
jgi:acylphosphatase